MRRFLTVLLVIVGLSVASKDAQAQATHVPIQVLAVSSDKSFEHAQALTIALKRAVTRAEGFALGKGDFSLEVLSLALNCEIPPSDSCQKKIADKVGVKRYIWGTLEVKGKEAVAELHLWEDGSEKRATTLRYASNLTDPSDDTLLQIAEGGFAELMGATQGVLVVTAGNVSGEVFIDGEKVGLITDGRTELTVAPGQHQVLVRAKGYNDASGSVDVRPGASAEITLAPSPKSAGNLDAKRDTGKGMTTRQMLGYGGLGLGGAVALTGGYFWFQSYMQTKDDDFQAYRDRLGPNRDACEVAKTGADGVPPDASIVDHCDKNATTKTVARILLPVGVVTAGAGAFLLLTDDSSEQPQAKKKTPTKTAVQPFVGFGPGGGEVRVNVLF